MSSIIFEKLKKSRFHDLLIDSHTQVSSNNRRVLTRVFETLRYRFAGYGIPLTKNEKKLSHLRNLHTGSRAFILGNGPSLNLCNLRPLANEITFGVNAIYLNIEKMGFHPTYYVVEDIFVAEDRAKEINSYRGPIKFFGNYLNYCIQNQPNTLWLNVRMNYNNYQNFPLFSLDARRMVWVGGTVTYICLQLAYYMGISQVYLVGFDHSYSIPEDAEINGTKITSRSNDPNHFDKSYFGKDFRWHDPQLDRMEKAYRKSKIQFELDGRKIYNSTIGGNLEIFDRIDYRKLVF
jgi:hypothetical protein